MPNIELNIKKYDKYFITPDYNNNNSRSYFKKIEKILEYGVKLIQFRSKNLSKDQYNNISKKIYDICIKYDSYYIINDFNNFKNNTYCDGIHLTSDNLLHYNSYNIPSDYIVVGSCHNEKEIDICNSNSFNFIVVSPIFDTGKKEGFGWDKFQYFTNKSSAPVFALGGMNYKRDINLVKEHGGHGIASMSYFHNLFDV
tara:strand:- start:404 stop:997 length:594 start_codon:yes stop_codon:yes gene_type:complete